MPRIYMSFMLGESWLCQFLEADLKTPLPKKIALLNRDTVMAVAKRGGALPDLESEQALRHGIEIGRGGVWLDVTEEQYRKLK